MLSNASFLKSYKRLLPVVQWLSTFNVSVVNEVFFFKASQRSGNQSSLTSLLLLSVKLKVFADVFCAKPSNTPRYRKSDPIQDMPSSNSFIVRFNVVINLFSDNPVWNPLEAAHSVPLPSKSLPSDRVTVRVVNGRT